MNTASPVGVVNLASLAGVVAKRMIAPGEKFYVKVGVRLILGCDLYMGGHGNVRSFLGLFCLDIRAHVRSPLSFCVCGF